MHIFIEDLKGLWKRIIINLSCDFINEEINKKIKNLSKNMRIAGFRVGKVPISFLKQQYGDHIHQNVVNDLMKKNFINLISKHKIKPISCPEYKIIKSCNTVNKRFIYSVIVEVYPKIQLTGLDNIVIEKPIVNITNDDIDLVINTEKQQYTCWENSDDKQIDIGDRITFSVSVQSQNTTIIQNVCFYDIENVKIIIGHNNHQTIYDLEKNIIGKHIGDQCTIYIDCLNHFNITALDRYVPVIFTIQKIETAKLSNLNKDYFKYYNRTTVKKNIKDNLDNIIRQYIKSQVINSILNANDFDIPTTLIQNELNVLKNKVKGTAYYINNQLSEHSLYSLIFQKFNLEYQAKRRIKFFLLLNEIIQSNNIKIDYESVPKFIEKNLNESRYFKKIIRSLRYDVTTKNYISAVLTEEYVINFLIEQAKIVEKKITFSQLMRML